MNMQDKYDEHRAEIETKLEQIKLALCNHDANQKNEPSWGYVGNLCHVEEMLNEVVNFLK